MHICPLLDPPEHIPLVVHQHLAETCFGRLDQLPVALGGLALAGVVPDAVRVGDEYEGILQFWISAHPSLQGLGARMGT